MFPLKYVKPQEVFIYFKIFGHLRPDQITLERKLLWDIVKIDQERSPYDFKWNHNTLTCIGHNTIEINSCLDVL